jgi:hypothetical protein
LWVLGPVVAQDLVEKENNLHAQGNGTDEVVFSDFHAPQLGGHIGCGDGYPPFDSSRCDGGNDFNHWNSYQFNGAISKICFRVGSVKAIHHKDWITGGKFCYAGHCVSEGTGADDCFMLTAGEAIVELSATSGCKPRGADHWGVSSITIKTNHERTKYWGHRECSGHYTIKAPQGKHITSFYGRASGGHAGWGGLFSKIGVFYDVGMGQGQWKNIAGGPGVRPPSFKMKTCTTASSSTSVSRTSEWSISSYSEMSLGFEMVGISGGSKRSITMTYSQSITRTTQSSFETTDCREQDMSCDDGQNYAFQFVFTSDFDNRGLVNTFSNHWVCTDQPRVCCLPGYFKNPQRASDGCVDGSPNVCTEVEAVPQHEEFLV